MRTPKRRRLVPEVVQTSAMDCGPAALAAYLGGHGISVSYGRLREACQTDIDGTVIETLEELSTALGVPVVQTIVPKDLVLLEEAASLPAMAVLRLPNGNPHFAVVWSLSFGVAQVMDPASGRRWVTRGQLLDEVHEHVMSVPAADWWAWASSPDGQDLLRAAWRQSGLAAEAVDALLQEALADRGWRSLAALDASARAVRNLVEARAVDRGSEAAELARRLFARARENESAIPRSYWSVRAGGEETLVIRGAVVLRPARDGELEAEPAELPSAVEAARTEEPRRPLRELGNVLWRERAFTPWALLAGFFGAAFAIVIEALLFRSFLELAPSFALPGQRLAAVAVLVLFLLIVLGLELGSVTGELRLGRRLETVLSVAFREKLPRLGDRYFASRLVSDMAERYHSLHLLRTLPRLGGQLLRTGFELVLTTGALIWLEPTTAPLALAVLATSVAVPIWGQPLLQERDLRVRSHVGALSRFYLDALLGLVPLRAHGAGDAVLAEHESLLVQWARSRLGLQRAAMLVEGVQFLVGYGLIVLLVVSYLSRGGETAAVLLLAYWALNLPVLGLELVELAWRYPEARNITLRVTEPLHALEEEDAAPAGGASIQEDHSGEGASLRLEHVTVRTSGHVLLEDIDLSIEAGSHVAIVGPSGAGKTSLLGLLLGWHFPDEGRVLVDGSLLSRERLSALRSEIAWVDPVVQLWNRSLAENLRYGTGASSERLERVIERVELRPVVAALPSREETVLGEGGGLVSGGEGQRVRFGRAVLREKVRLVLLDEPFRGLGRDQRAELLRRAREHWKKQSLLCVTHDLTEAESFDRVLVLDRGKLVEDGDPRELARERRSRFYGLIEAERKLEALWRDESWRRFEIDGGRLREATGAS